MSIDYKNILNKLKHVPENLTSILNSKSNIGHKHSKDDIDNLELIESTLTDVVGKAGVNETAILGINNELSKSENTKYKTVDGSKEFECKDGYIDNVIIDGKTLINVSEIVQKGWNDELQDCIRARFYTGGNKPYECITNGVYTFYNFTDKLVIFPILSKSDNSLWGKGIEVQPMSCQVATISNEYTCVGADFWVRNGWQHSDMDSIKSSNIMVLEGEHQFMPYFKGIKSVGQGDYINLVTYKENLLDYTKLINKVTNGETGELADNLNRLTLDVIDRITIHSSKLLVKCTDIRFAIICFVEKDGIPIYDSTYLPPNTISEVILPKETKYISFNINNKSLPLSKEELKDHFIIQKYDKQTISHTLRSLPTRLCDTIEKIGDKYYKVQRCNEIVLDGSCEVKDDSKYYNETTIKPYIVNMLSDADTSAVNTVDFYCDRFKPNNIYSLENMIEGIYYSSNKNFHIRVRKSKLSTPNAQGFKEWLIDNPITVVYKLAKPVITELPNFNPRTFKGQTTLIFNSGIVQSECSFDITNSLGSSLNIMSDKLSELNSFKNQFNNHNHNYQKHPLTQDSGRSIFIPPNSSLNDYILEGHYNGSMDNGIEEAPSDLLSNEWFFLEVMSHCHTSNYCYQKLTTMTRTDSNQLVFERIRHSGSWTPWREL